MTLYTSAGTPATITAYGSGSSAPSLSAYLPNNSKHGYVDINGNYISFDEWTELFENWAYRRVGDTYSNDNVVNVSTVWIGQAPGSIFESRVFFNDGLEHEEVCERYNTLEEAKEGHEKLVSQYITRVEVKKEYTADGNPQVLADGAL